MNTNAFFISICDVQKVTFSFISLLQLYSLNMVRVIGTVNDIINYIQRFFVKQFVLIFLYITFSAICINSLEHKWDTYTSSYILQYFYVKTLFWLRDTYLKFNQYFRKRIFRNHCLVYLGSIAYCPLLLLPPINYFIFLWIIFLSDFEPLKWIENSPKHLVS